ncbi:hypothetical protein [Mycobacterium sp. BK086]|nr:hypothetical protein [Mycobacterium sp. BK086]
MSDSPMWLPYPRAVLVGMGRCPDCGCHVETQGHKDNCPTLVVADGA